MSAPSSLEPAAMTREAMNCLAGVVDRTPLVTVLELDRRTGARVFLKLENQQKTGSFEVRGAFNKLLSHQGRIPAAGVVAGSSGNHGIAVSFAAKALGVKATIVVPRDAPQTKLDAIEKYSADVITYDRSKEDREQVGRAFSVHAGALIVPAYDDPWVIAGQGTAAEETLLQIADFGLSLDVLLVSCSGDGLMAGSTMPFPGLGLETNIYAVEPEGYDGTLRSLCSSVRCSNDLSQRSLCDSLMTPIPGELTFSINKDRLAGALTVSDDEVLGAIAFAYRTLDLILEPGGAVALAALLNGKVDVKGQTVVVILSDSNIDKPILSMVLGIPADSVNHNALQNR